MIRIITFATLFLLANVTYCFGGNYSVFPLKVISAKHEYRNPYYRANPHYEPREIGTPEWVINPFFREGKAESPKPLTTIIIHDTGNLKDWKVGK